MADHLAEFPRTEEQGLEPEFPDEGIFSLDTEERWQLFFDGAANKRGNGVGILLVDPKDEHTPIAIKLNFTTTNNAVEYEACIAGLEAALERNVKELEVYGDSALIINQTSKKWKTVDPYLQQYQTYMDELVRQFREVTFHYLPRDRNRFADSLATLASSGSTKRIPIHSYSQGSGSIFETLRLGKPLIVVVNEDLMDNHQSELAEELAERKHLFCARPQSLYQIIGSMNLSSLVPYPSGDATPVAKLINRYLGFPDD